jgi:hypothetical protein
MVENHNNITMTIKKLQMLTPSEKGLKLMCDLLSSITFHNYHEEDIHQYIAMHACLCGVCISECTPTPTPTHGVVRERH